MKEIILGIFDNPHQLAAENEDSHVKLKITVPGYQP
jgi:hypothetical protein